MQHTASVSSNSPQKELDLSPPSKAGFFFAPSHREAVSHAIFRAEKTLYRVCSPTGYVLCSLLQTDARSAVLASHDDVYHPRTGVRTIRPLNLQTRGYVKVEE